MNEETNFRPERTRQQMLPKWGRERQLGWKHRRKYPHQSIHLSPSLLRTRTQYVDRSCVTFYHCRRRIHFLQAQSQRLATDFSTASSEAVRSEVIINEAIAIAKEARKNLVKRSHFRFRRPYVTVFGPTLGMGGSTVAHFDQHVVTVANSP